MKTVLILIHMLYSHECCEDHHCRPVPCNEVIDLGDDGWRWRDRTFPRWTLRASPDGNCHVCVANIPVCIYLPPCVGGFHDRLAILFGDYLMVIGVVIWLLT